MSTTTSQARDTRAVNDGSSPLPSTLALAVNVAGVLLGTLAIPQATRLSKAGNVTFSGGIRKGWNLPGEVIDALSSLSFSVDGVELSMAASGVHRSAKTPANTTVCHTGVVELDAGEDETRSYMVQVYATHVAKKGAYALSVRAFPQGGGVAGPQVIGEIEGDFDLS